MFMISDIKIGLRLFLGFGLVLLCAFALLALGLWRMSELQEDTDFIVKDKVAGLSNASDMREDGMSVALMLRKIVTPTDSSEGERESKKLAWVAAEYAKSEESLNKLVASANGKVFLAKTIEQKQGIQPVITKIRTLIDAGNFFDAALLLKTDFLPLHE